MMPISLGALANLMDFHPLTTGSAISYFGPQGVNRGDDDFSNSIQALIAVDADVQIAESNQLALCHLVELAARLSKNEHV
ncbi:hypothetical protein FRC03_002450 [Tulasnella sp. 419]|nr:hypothetical protein FRC03_002450 [Tulasnella sp. 419]